ncbi:MAG: leucine--tRNA ligase [Candidatus Brocadiae bacterium]|nr:leucine--tRNA ligase [Candidatus Brocadiia bacterium]
MEELYYDFKQIEAKWQKKWDESNLFEWNKDKKPNMYCLVMFPYPSGALHMGHVLNYTISDSVVRYHLSQGKSVLSPMGWDAFGLPAENAAIKAKTPPQEYTKKNIKKMREQIKRAGWGYDWSREVATCSPEYYKWTQWLFLQFFKNGLAYKKMAPVNWCPNDKTVLANEQVHDGNCERCGTPVEQKDLRQWFYAMSQYSQRLLDGHKKLEGRWPEKVLKMQKEWIGRSEGAKLDFKLENSEETVSVFTTRPDTVYGVTFMSLAPEHPLIEKLLPGNPKEEEIRAAVKKMRNQSAIERSSEESEKEGIFTGHYLINPFNQDRVQLWIANYALMDYGTGAVMAVPAHDQRDFLFAKKYGLPIKVVIQPEGETFVAQNMTKAYIQDGIQVNSAHFNGMPNTKAMNAITQYAKDQGFGDFTVKYRLKDWLLSRQRYWGAPIPIIYCEKCGMVPVPEKDLPVLLPENVEFLPGGESPLERCKSWKSVPCPVCGNPAERESDTMDTFVDSSWYFLRYLSPKEENRAFDPDLAKEWLPVHLYIGGSEHSNMHLIYARFFTMVLKDLGYLEFDEPFQNLFCQGMVCRAAYWCPEHLWVSEKELDFQCEKCGTVVGTQTDISTEKIEIQGAKAKKVTVIVCKSCNGKVHAYHRECGKEVKAEMAKMSKTKKNGVSPDELFERYGADTLRVGILRLGQLDQELVYSDNALVGEHKFLQKIYRTVMQLKERLSSVSRFDGKKETTREEKDLRRKAHQCLQAAHDAFAKDFPFNTLIARLHELLRDLNKAESVSPEIQKEAVDALLFILSPFAPHLSEELWEQIGGKNFIHFSPWPSVDQEALKLDEIEIVIQINGKIKSRLMVAADMESGQLQEYCLKNEKVLELLAGKTPKKIVAVPNKLVNIIL